MLNGGVDVVYDTVGYPGTIEVGVRITRPRGAIVVTGVEMPRRFEWTPLYFKEIHLIGSNAFGEEDFEGRAAARDGDLPRPGARAPRRRDAHPHAPLRARPSIATRFAPATTRAARARSRCCSATPRTALSRRPPPTKATASRRRLMQQDREAVGIADQARRDAGRVLGVRCRHEDRAAIALATAASPRGRRASTARWQSALGGAAGCGRRDPAHELRERPSRRSSTASIPSHARSSTRPLAGARERCLRHHREAERIAIEGERACHLGHTERHVQHADDRHDFARSALADPSTSRYV